MPHAVAVTVGEEKCMTTLFEMNIVLSVRVTIKSKSTRLRRSQPTFQTHHVVL